MRPYNLKKPLALEIILLVIVLGIIAAVCSCSSGDDGESAIARTQRLLQSSWRLEKLTVDGVDQTALFSNLVMTISNNTYTTQNGEPVWPASGTWSLTDENTITRDNNTEVTIVSLSETTVTLQLHWDSDTFSPGRNASVGGDHIFEFSREE
jgi:hypothetical protein